MADPPAPVKKVAIHDVLRMKRDGQKLVCVTAYDVLFAKIVDSAGVDIVLVGDSLGNVVAGFETTLPVTLEHMIYHGQAVRRGVRRAMLVIDLPFLSYQASEESAVMNAGRVLQQTEADAVKLEGGSEEVVRTVRRLTTIGRISANSTRCANEYCRIRCSVSRSRTSAACRCPPVTRNSGPF